MVVVAACQRLTGYSGVRAPTVARTRAWTVKRLVERDGDVVLVEWEGFVDPGPYTWESVSLLFQTSRTMPE